MSFFLFQDEGEAYDDDAAAEVFARKLAARQVIGDIFFSLSFFIH
jgi:hypothetical protein